MKKHIYLIGFMGVGKSTVSRQLMKLLNTRELDMDAFIVQENGMSINEMFSQFGEEYFRGKESRLLHRLKTVDPMIVSCGGGVVMRPENVEVMKQCGVIVLLKAQPETIFERVRYGKDRPLLNGHMNVEYIAELMEKRRPAYEGAADIVVDTDRKTPEQIAREIIEKYNTFEAE